MPKDAIGEIVHRAAKSEREAEGGGDAWFAGWRLLEVLIDARDASKLPDGVGILHASGELQLPEIHCELAEKPAAGSDLRDAVLASSWRRPGAEVDQPITTFLAAVAELHLESFSSAY
jgi:hypothetical protein